MSRTRHSLAAPLNQVRLARQIRPRGGRPSLVHLSKREKLRQRALRLDLKNEG